MFAAPDRYRSTFCTEAVAHNQAINPILARASALVTSDAQHQVRLGKQEKDLSDYKLYVAERYASNEYLSETKREILESIRDLARRIEHP